MSDITKSYKRNSIIFSILSIILVSLPVIIYLCMAFYYGDVHEKLTLGITVLIAGLLSVVNLVFKYHIRSIIWILVLGIYFCLDNIMPLLLTVAICTILDEFIITPLHNTYKNKYKINNEIDKRLE